MRRPPGSGEMNCHCNDSLGQTNRQCLIFNVAPTYARARAFALHVMRRKGAPSNRDRALLLVKLNYLKWGHEKEQSNFKGAALLAGPRDRPIRIQEPSGTSGSPNMTPKR